MSYENDAVQAFIDHWSKAEASEMANSQSFIKDLTSILGVPQPSNSHSDGYSFEFPVKVPGSLVGNRIDLYRRSCFVWESKQFVAPKEEQTDLELTAIKAGVAPAKKKSGPLRGSGAWDDAMFRARGQAERYVRYLPADEPNPPFIIVCDVGHSFEIYADFTQNGKAYLPFPDPRTFRINLKDLADEDIRKRLHLIWTNPAALDPAKISAEVTREIAGYLAELAKSLEQQKHDPEVVAQFLTRCLFCMFAEDVGLLPEDSFKDLLASLPPDGNGFVAIIGTLFREMNSGTQGDISVVLRQKLLRFNGGLFADDTVLPINGLQLGLLKQAAGKQWKNVEPAIFGTLLERALNPTERHALGAHFTPRAYVERLVLPTVIEPLREEWEAVRAAAVALRNRREPTAAIQEINRFHDYLCEIKVLDPACGSGNFLYVALEHMKRLEGEVLDMALAFGDTERAALSTHTVDPHQFLGIEINPRAASIAELVLWIGYLQWHFRTRSQTMPEEPVLKSFKNIECRDAVLEYDGDSVPAMDENGKIIKVWDRVSQKTDLLTGRDVPDETMRKPRFRYSNPRRAVWPCADFIVGNPPFIANRNMRLDLGDGYVDALSTAYPDITQAVDFVMYFWKNAAEAVSSDAAIASGLVTTSRIRLQQNQSVVTKAVDQGCRITFAIPDHPWVDSGAKVRIAMTVLFSRKESNSIIPVLLISPDHDQVVSGHRDTSEDIDYSKFEEIRGSEISCDLSKDIDIARLVELKLWSGLSHAGLKPYAETLLISEEVSKNLFPDKELFVKHARRYRNGQDIARIPRGVRVLDFYGLDESTIRTNHPKAYQYLLTHTKEERSQERNLRLRNEWWLFEANRPEMRKGIVGLSRYIVTVENSPIRYFTFVESDILPDQKLRVVTADDAFVLGCLSSRTHGVFSARLGGRHGVANTPVYNTRCTTSFPIPLCDEATKEQIRGIAEKLDAHRKRVQAQHGLTLTGLYNVLEKLRANQPLTDKEKIIHDQGLVSILNELHEKLDEAVLHAYGWADLMTFYAGSYHPFGTPECRKEFEQAILTRLVALNAHRAAEEKQGIIHWLRPDYQTQFLKAGKQLGLDLSDKDTGKTRKTKGSAKKAKKKVASKTKQVWPKPLAERIRATEQALHAAGTAVSSADLAKLFARAKPAAVQEILESLVTLGRAQQHGDTFSR